MLRHPRRCSLCDRSAEVLVTARVEQLTFRNCCLGWQLTFRNCCLGCVSDRRMLGWTVKVA